MTREEFIQDINYIDELKEFISDCGFSDIMLEDVYSFEEMSDYIDDEIVDWARDNNWEDLYGMLEDIPRNRDGWYVRDDWSNSGWVEYDHDYRFEDDKSDVLNEIDSNYPETWDDERPEDEPDEPDEPEEEIDFDGFIAECNDEAQQFVNLKEPEFVLSFDMSIYDE